MIARFFLSSLGASAVCISLANSAALAQERSPSVFFGFGYILEPLTYKWACGGERARDLAQIARLTAAYPTEAKRVGLQEAIDETLEVLDMNQDVFQVMHPGIAEDVIEKICAAALPLEIDWLTPESIVDDADENLFPEQQLLWENFFQVAETL